MFLKGYSVSLVITEKQIKTIKDRTANVKKQSQTGWRHAVSGTFVDCPWEYQLLQPLLTVSTKTEHMQILLSPAIYENSSYFASMPSL